MNRIVVFSGGLDSATVLYLQVSSAQRGDHVIPLAFNYGQKAWQMELKAAQGISMLVGNDFKVLHSLSGCSVPGISLMFGDNVLTNPMREVPRQDRTKEVYDELEDHVVPNRNVIMVEIAVAYAISLGEPALVSYGAQASDVDGFDLFPDVLAPCVKLLDQMADYTSKGMVRVYAPLVRMVKTQVIQLAVKLGVPIKSTWSCYNNGVGPQKLQCGDCASCVDRRLAFERLGLTHLDVKYARRI